MSLYTYALVDVWIVIKKYTAWIVACRLHSFLRKKGKGNLQRFGYIFIYLFFLYWCFAVPFETLPVSTVRVQGQKASLSVSYREFDKYEPKFHSMNHVFLCFDFALLLNSNVIKISRPWMFSYWKYLCLDLIILTWTHLSSCN